MTRRREHDVTQLTTREEQVLDLLRRGYSNRDIAQELGISLAGAKYHVSEIISRLGVSSREEAASWSERSQRWGFVTPLLGMFPSWVKWAHPSKLAVSVGLAFVALSGAGLGGFLLLAGVLGSKGTPSTTDLDPCAGIPGCRPISERRYTTIEEAAAHASFVPMLPGSLPDGFEPHIVLATDRDLSTSHAANPQAVHNDWITVVYRNAAGDELLISQGFPARPEALWFTGLDGAEVGESQVNDHEATWARNRSELEPFAQGVYRSVLTLFLGRFGTGWGEEASWFSGSPMTYTIAGSSLAVQDLAAIAESVVFPDIVQPYAGATPQPYFH